MQMSSNSTIAREYEGSEEADSSLARLWRRWQAKVRRDRARSLSQVRFRLTREGWHFLFVLVFIFVGAVIREINLLILLAGTMIGLLVLHWRFGSRVLHGLRLRRIAPARTSVGIATEVALEITNTRTRLGSWLILAEDQLQKIAPNTQRLVEKGVTLVDEIQPQRTMVGRYELMIHERGKYRLGSTTLSTRFPIGLGRSWRTLDNAWELTVHPRRGRLLPACRSLLQSDREGNARAMPRSSVHEGEFYGLRDWQTGDSRRWIHWRTTAKKGELSVRQFEQLQRQRLSIVLDLYQSKTKPTAEERGAIELAISFAATLASDLVNRDRDKLSFSLVGESVRTLLDVQSAVLVDNLLDHLAQVQPSSAPKLAAAIGELSSSLMYCPVLLVISTRSSQMSELREGLSDLNRRLLGRLQVRWLNVSAGDLAPYFDLASND
jgi:uncharacterized protein (DUF58 family)